MTATALLLFIGLHYGHFAVLSKFPGGREYPSEMDT